MLVTTLQVKTRRAIARSIQALKSLLRNQTHGMLVHRGNPGFFRSFLDEYCQLSQLLFGQPQAVVFRIADDQAATG